MRLGFFIFLANTANVRRDSTSYLKPAEIYLIKQYVAIPELHKILTTYLNSRLFRLTLSRKSSNFSYWKKS